MVIINTMAIDVSIQAVSPELGEQLVRVLASQAGGAAAAATGASAAVSAKDAWKVGRLSKIARTSAPARAKSPARENRMKIIGFTPVRLGRGAGLLDRDELWLDRNPALAFCLSMIFSENRFPLFRIML